MKTTEHFNARTSPETRKPNMGLDLSLKGRKMMEKGDTFWALSAWKERESREQASAY